MTQPAPRPGSIEAYHAVRGLPGRCIIMPDVDDLVDLLGDDLMDAAMQTAQAGRPFHLALSGGTTPRILFRRLIIDPRYRLFPWDRTHLWLVDERCVDFNDERSNFRMIRETLVQHVPIDPAQVHPMPVGDGEADLLYEAELDRVLGPAGRLDYTMLGMGPDAHTASLFPHSPALDERDQRVVFNTGPAVTPPRPRLTLTFPCINASRTIAVLVTGASKRPAIQRVAQAQTPDTAELPITGVTPAHPDGQLLWYLDEASVRGDD